jgi:integrase
MSPRWQCFDARINGIRLLQSAPFIELARCPGESRSAIVSSEAKARWEATAVQNLVRYRPAGTYFARFRVNGKRVWKSLETTVFSVAKQRLPETMRERRAKLESVTAVAIGKMTVGDAVHVYLEKVRADVSLKPRSKDYRETMIDFIDRSWPALFGTDVRKVSERDCQEWLVRFQKLYAPSVVNNGIGTLRAVFAEAVDSGARFGNPAANLSRVRIRAKRLELPSREEFLRFVEEIRTAGARQSKDCANLVRFLAYSGLRIGEARFVTWADANFSRHQLHVRGDPVTATKNGETRYVPMIPELEQMLTELRKERAKEPLSATVMRVFECQNSMTQAASKIGMKRITHHDLRHLFATICIESGVDIPTVSRWLGHKDGGALCMKTYGHLRQDHSLAQAQRVSFGIAA